MSQHQQVRESAAFRFGCALFLVLTCSVWLPAQTTQEPSGESTSRPAQPPTPPDAPEPDQGTETSAPPKSAAKRTLNKLDPHCIDVIFHSCWSSPAANAANSTPSNDEIAAKDIDVGYYYLKDKNYRAAESRLKEALDLKPDASVALIGLAQAQQKLGQQDEARQTYEAYLKLNPDGPDADKVKKALAQLK
jgi:tetratricopeptide (TPR) repeat protein